MNFTKQLLSWYDVNKRDLPWRRTKDPYLVWISEIILQQTRIDQGLPYYERFVNAFPNVKQLAEAEEQEVLKLWQGLGYYSRARNLHGSARMIMKEHDGRFPDTYSGIRNLKGIGDYTAAAVASIVYDLPYPVIDGNVVRFFSRYFGIMEAIGLAGTKKRILKIAGELIDHGHPGDFNQGVMEFGARVCTPVNPGCNSCIFNKKCFATVHKMVAELPVRPQKTMVRKRYLHYLVLTCCDGGEDYIYLNKRTGNDIWRNLFDFPQVEPDKGAIEDQPMNQQAVLALFKSGDFKSIGDANPDSQLLRQFRSISKQYDHQLTHQRLHVWFYQFHFNKKVELPYLMVPFINIHTYPLPRLIDKYLIDIFPGFR